MSSMAGTDDDEARYQAIRARDARFDGVIFVGVTTTGVYCRPICPAKTPARARCRFFRSAAEAEREGFRACFRCRPELAPGAAPVDASARLGRLAVQHIDEGFMNERRAPELASSLGVSDRHLRRVLMRELGVTPVGLAQTRRLAVAKQLLHDTRLPLAQVAFASGFSSVRRFNAAFLERFACAPSALRRARGSATESAPGDRLTVRLDYRAPLAWEPLLAFLGARALPGIERVEHGVYQRVIGEATTVEVKQDARRGALLVTMPGSLAPRVAEIAARVRRLFDLDAHPDAVGERLGADPRLAPIVAHYPGLRVPGAFEPFEAAVRAVLGQQVSVRAATTLAARLVATFGAPRAEILARSEVDTLRALGLTGARAHTLIALARAVDRGAVSLTPLDPEQAIARLEALPGIGHWTANYIAMRAMGWPDAFPAADLGVKKALAASMAPAGAGRASGSVAGRLGSTSAILARAQAWRPWRAYAVMYLWHS